MATALSGQGESFPGSTATRLGPFSIFTQGLTAASGSPASVSRLTVTVITPEPDLLAAGSMNQDLKQGLHIAQHHEWLNPDSIPPRVGPDDRRTSLQ